MLPRAHQCHETLTVRPSIVRGSSDGNMLRHHRRGQRLPEQNSPPPSPTSILLRLSERYRDILTGPSRLRPANKVDPGPPCLLLGVSQAWNKPPAAESPPPSKNRLFTRAHPIVNHQGRNAAQAMAAFRLQHPLPGAFRATRRGTRESSPSVPRGRPARLRTTHDAAPSMPDRARLCTHRSATVCKPGPYRISLPDGAPPTSPSQPTPARAESRHHHG